MSLEDMAKESRYVRLKRFLDSQVGKRWDVVYSKICHAAPINSKRGSSIRQDVTHYVDTKGPSPTRYRDDYYVDDQGYLRKTEQISWKQRYRERRDNAPIERIMFVEDGNDTWYELMDIPDGPRASKYTKYHKVWFQFIRKYFDDSYPIYEYVDGKMTDKIIGTKPIIREELHKRQCNSKEIKKLQPIATRQWPILKLFSQEKAADEAHQWHKFYVVVAQVAGSIGK